MSCGDEALSFTPDVRLGIAVAVVNRPTSISVIR
jgi:hypothetical protein